MRKLTDGEWAHVREVWDAAADGKTIQKWGRWRDGHEKGWLDMDGLISMLNLVTSPESYRVKPEPTTVTVYVHRMPDGKTSISDIDLSKCGNGWELLYSFEHEVQA